jgi:hypothetical protein
MKKLLVVFALLGRMFATNQCAEHNIYLSETAVTVSTYGSARCTPGVAGGIQYNCPEGSGGMTVWGFDIQSPCFTAWVSYAVQTPDNSTGAHYDLGLYYINGPSAPSLAGQLIVHTGQLTGTAFTPHVGLTTISWVGTANCWLPIGESPIVHILYGHCAWPSAIHRATDDGPFGIPDDIPGCCNRTHFLGDT